MLEEALVAADELGAGLRAELLLLHLLPHDALDAAEQVVREVLHVGEHLVHRRAGDLLLDVVAAGLVGVGVDVGLGDAAEQVVRVAHDVLVGAHEEEAEEVRLAGAERVVLDGALVLLVLPDVARDLAVGVAREVHEDAALRGLLVQPVEREDGEALPDGPVVQHALEHREVAQHLRLEVVADAEELLREPHLGRGLAHGAVDAPEHAPVERLGVGLRFEVEVAEAEERAGVGALLDGVVVGFEEPRGVGRRGGRAGGVHARERVGEVLQHGRRVGADGHVAGARGRAVRRQRLDDEHGVVGGERAAGLRDELGHGHAGRVAHVLDGPHDGVGVLLERVAHGALGVVLLGGGGVAGAVADAEAAAHVERLDAEAALAELDVDLRGLFGGLLQRLDVGDLAAEVEVEQHERVLLVRRFEVAHDGHEVGRGDAELRAVAGGRGPLAGAARGELDADAEAGGDLLLVGEPHEAPELVGLLHHRHDALAEALPEQHGAQHGRVFVAVADEQRAVALEVGERGDELGLRAALQPDAVGLAGLQDLLDHLVQLVHLDRVDRRVAPVVAGLGDGRAERLVQPDDPRAQDVLKAEQQRRLHAVLAELLREPEDVDLGAVGVGPGVDAAVVADGEEAVGPGGQAVERLGVGGRPGLGGRFGLGQGRVG